MHSSDVVSVENTTYKELSNELSDDRDLPLHQLSRRILQLRLPGPSIRCTDECGRGAVQLRFRMWLRRCRARLSLPLTEHSMWTGEEPLRRNAMNDPALQIIAGGQGRDPKRFGARTTSGCRRGLHL